MLEGPLAKRWDICMKANLNEFIDNSRSCSIKSPSKNQGTWKAKSKGGKFTKLKWFFKKQKSRLGGQGPSPHEHTLQHALEPSFAQVVVGGAKHKKNLERTWALRDLGPKIKLQQALVLEKNAPLEVPPISKQKPLESGPSFLVLGRATLSGENKTSLKEINVKLQC